MDYFISTEGALTLLGVNAHTMEGVESLGSAEIWSRSDKKQAYSKKLKLNFVELQLCLATLGSS